MELTRTTVPISDISLSDLERQYLLECWSTGMLSWRGEFVGRFERELKQRCARTYGIAVANGTVALEVALQALDIKAGDEVIVPALTFVSPAAAVKRMGAIPVFADVNPSDWTLDPDEAAAQITDRTRAIIAVDVIGNPCNFSELERLQLPIIEDAAEAHGAAYHGRPVGSFGVMSTFSFFGNKALSCGEGGIILTDSPGLEERLRMIVSHGMRLNAGYNHELVGTNARMNNLTAAVALAQTQRWDELIGRRNQVAVWYKKKIKPEWGFMFRPVAPNAKESCWLFTVMHRERDRIVNRLNQMGVDARAIWGALSSLPLYASSRRGDYPVAEAVADHALFLPTSAKMDETTVDYVVECLRRAVDG